MHSDIDAPDQRLMAYFEELGSTLSRFDTLSLAAIGIACTGSSYLLSRKDVSTDSQSEQRDTKPHCYPAAAIEEALITLGAKRIAPVSPH